MVIVLWTWLSLLTCTVSSLRPSSPRLHQRSEDDISPSRARHRRVLHVPHPGLCSAHAAVSSSVCSCWLLHIESSHDHLTRFWSQTRPDSCAGVCEDVRHCEILLPVSSFPPLGRPSLFYDHLKEIEKLDWRTKSSFNHALLCV